MSSSDQTQTNTTRDPGPADQGLDTIARGATRTGSFLDRHLGPRTDEIDQMLAAIGVPSLEALIEQTVPASITDRELTIGPGQSEPSVTQELVELAAKNRVVTSMIGQGYHGSITPPVLRRNILENPAWYTAYTPYQPEISQGRLEALLNFQTMVTDLTGLEIANASLLDEATAAAEAMAMVRRMVRNQRAVFRVDDQVHPQTLAVLRTRAEPVGVTIEVAARTAPVGEDVFGVLFQYPGTTGEVYDLEPLVQAAHAAGAKTIAAADLLSLVLLRSPGSAGIDVAVGSTQRFGLPLGCGGPHAAFIAARSGTERMLPGRVVGVSLDADGEPALRLALQTREQHIRRDKATSNICTAQVLPAVMAAMYACWHGADGLRSIAARAHAHATSIAAGIQAAGLELAHDHWFDTIAVRVPGRADAVVAAALGHGINLRRVGGDLVVVACDETTTEHHVRAVLAAFEVPHASASESGPGSAGGAQEPSGLGGLERSGPLLSFAAFEHYRSETEMLRYLRRLSDQDLALDRTMIPLGSCTMKLNATTQMEPITWPGFADLHPFAPADQLRGTAELVDQLEAWLSEITGYAAVSIQPNAGSQGELAGLLAIRLYHRSRGEDHRQVCLIPESAHGTNAASAVMAGMRVAVVACDDDGNVDLGDLSAKCDQYRDELAAIMITYPSTHGVFEEGIVELCATVHDAGGQVYLDGANLNALVGLSRPGRFGADVSHLNLHKTFCIPHGGGGPGVGPVAVAAHLAPFLPRREVAQAPIEVAGGSGDELPMISATPWGSAGILSIPWAYIRLMGSPGLRAATATAILGANYIATRLDPFLPVLYRGSAGRVAHECILDVRPLRERSGITVDDIAKRLIDYGFHAPTMSFPVAGTLMVEPTESESLEEIDRFCDAMIAIVAEAERVATGEWPLEDNPLVHAPHTAAAATAEEWAHPYSRQVAAWPGGHHRSKYWPPVARIDGAHGDRNFACSCPPLHELAESETDTETVSEAGSAPSDEGMSRV